MAAVFMAQQARLLNNILFSFLLFLIGCTPSPGKRAPVTGTLANSTYTGLSNINGIVQLNKQPYSGKVYTLYNGTKDTAEITSWLNGKEAGEWTKYYETGNLRERKTFENGRKTGELIAWWPNGNKQLHYRFFNDEYEGTCREWNEAGKLVKEMNYKAGHEAGPQQSWYDNGRIRANYVIENGRRYGLLGTKNCVNVSDSIFK
jgi:antitoxin component YwqK of YwqJK toxin-antitoxin module